MQGVLVDRCNTCRHITETGSSKLKLTSKTKGQKRRNKQTNKQKVYNRQKRIGKYIVIRDEW